MQVKGLKDTIIWYDNNADTYAQATHTNTHHDQIDQFAALLRPHAKVLDAGCGAGRDTNLLALKGFTVIGMDLSKGLLTVAKRTYPTISFVKGDLRDLPFEEKSFDGIWAHASLLHLETVEDVSSALQEFSRVIKPEGILHLFVKAQTGSQKTAVVSDSLSNHDRFFQYFTTSELQSLLQEAGFSTLFIEQFRETDQNPHGRPEVEWILVLAKKV